MRRLGFFTLAALTVVGFILGASGYTGLGALAVMVLVAGLVRAT